MMGRTHALLGINALWLLEPLWMLEPWTFDRLFPWALLGSVVGALSPDLDAPVSLLSLTSFGGVRPLALPARWLNRRYGHRGALHSLRGWGAAALLFCPLLLIGFPAGSGLSLWLGLTLGYGSHLLGDATTRSGIPWRYPNPRRVHLLPKPFRLLTGSMAEDGVMFLFAVTALTLLLRHLSLGLPPAL